VDYIEAVKRGFGLLQAANGGDNVDAALLDEARALFVNAQQRATAPAHKGFACFYVAVSLLMAKDVSKALPYADSAVALLPQATCFYVRAHIALSMRKWAAAYTWLSRAADAGHAHAIAMLAVLYALEDMPDKALQYAEAAKRLGVELGTGFVELSLWYARAESGLPVDDCVFFASGEPPQDAASLPPNQSIELFQTTGAQQTDTVLFTMVDAGYFEQYAIPLVKSIAEHDPSVAVHIHIVNPAATTVALAAQATAASPGLALRITAETAHLPTTNAVAMCCSCVRFIRLLQFMEADAARLPYLVIDADSLLRRPLPKMQDLLGQSDVGVRIFEHEPAWQRYCAASVAVRHTDSGMSFLRYVAWYIWTHLAIDRGRWFLDQVALFQAAKRTKINPLPKAMCDIEDTPDTILLTAAGLEKLDPATRFNQLRLAYLQQL